MPGPEDRACAPPVDFVTVYEDFLRNGLRFPLNPVYRELIDGDGLILGKVMQNAYVQIIRLAVVAGRLGYPISSALVSRF